MESQSNNSTIIIKTSPLKTDEENDSIVDYTWY